MKTFTPELDLAVLERLREYATRFAPDFPQSKPARWAGGYLQGLFFDGERKSIEPLSHRVTRPPGPTTNDPEQALQQFVNQSPWDDQEVLTRYRALIAEPFGSPEGVFVLDDTRFPRRGRHSVGVQHQYCGALGKPANCQVAVTLHYSGPRGHFPSAVRLHSPESWTADTERMDAAGVPEEFRAAGTKGQIALGLIDRVRRRDPRGHGGRGPGVRGCRCAGRAGRAWIALHRRRAGYQRGVPDGARLGSPAAHRPTRAVAGPLGSGPEVVTTRVGRGGVEGLDVTAGVGAVGHQGPVVGAVWVGVAGARVEARVVCSRRAAVAAGRGAGRRAGAVRAVEPAAEDVAARGGAVVEAEVARRTGTSADEGGAGPGSLRGPQLAGSTTTRRWSCWPTGSCYSNTSAPDPSPPGLGKKGRPSHR